MVELWRFLPRVTLLNARELGGNFAAHGTKPLKLQGWQVGSEKHSKKDHMVDFFVTFYLKIISTKLSHFFFTLFLTPGVRLPVLGPFHTGGAFGSNT